jgi:8-amino-7-oxononanoate synthase
VAPLPFLREELSRLSGEGLLRRAEPWPSAGGRIRLPDGRTLLNFSSNDYLDLSGDPRVRRRAVEAVERYGCGAGGSRLMSGTLDLHELLEEALARLCGFPASLVFSSGFGMNVGIVSALAGKDDAIFADRLVHASLIDGARLSGAAFRRYPHNDAAGLGRLLASTPCRGRRIVVTESVFSMDGDTAPLEEIRTLCRRYDALLLVDEAHAVGVFGGGGGLARSLGDGAAPHFLAGTLGKAFGSLGGFVACSREGREFLVNRARSFVFATALPPPCLGAALGAAERIAEDPGMGERLLSRARAFHGLLEAEGLSLPPFRSQIVPVLVGGNGEALRLSARLREGGIVATAVRPPTVPVGTARLRLSVTLAHSRDDLARAAAEIGRAAREAGVAPPRRDEAATGTTPEAAP